MIVFNYCRAKKLFILLVNFKPILFFFGSLKMLPQSLSSEEFACQARDAGLIPGSGIFPGEGNGRATPVFLPEKFHTQRTWWTVVHGVSNSRTRLGD